MRKHIDYYYKCFDRIYDNEWDKNHYERFNEYGYNFDSNRQRNFNSEEELAKIKYKTCQRKVDPNKK